MFSGSSSDVYKMWQKLGKRRDLGEWEMWPSMVNAYYNPPGNEVLHRLSRIARCALTMAVFQIVFPAGILQPPFFSQDWYSYNCCL
jgi:endothelin-converting enzyme